MLQVEILIKHMKKNEKDVLKVRGDLAGFVFLSVFCSSSGKS